MSDDIWQPQINRELCTGCGDCIEACPTEALGKVEGKAALVRPEACTYCVACEDICPVGAIALPFLICRLDWHEGHGGLSASAPGRETG